MCEFENLVMDNYIRVYHENVNCEKPNEPPSGGVGIDGPFEVGDDWWYGETYGKCDPHTWVSDAADQMMLAMNNYIPDPGGSYFFSNLTPITKKGGTTELRRPADPNPPNNEFDYYLYSASDEWGTVTDNDLCLEYVEMNFYYSYLHFLLFEKIPGEDVPAAYTIESVTLFKDAKETTIPSQVHYYHKGIFQYGLKVAYEDGEYPSGL
jgi:hypothetical protein